MPKDTKKPWYENALLITFVGSTIVFVGQLAGTILPIMYGPYDFSDFSFAASPVAYSISIGNNTTLEGEIYSWDSHRFLRPYQSDIYLRVLGAPNGTAIKFVPPQIRPGEKSKMYIDGVGGFTAKRAYPIIIEGIGENGKKRNLTIYIDVFAPESPKQIMRPLLK